MGLGALPKKKKKKAKEEEDTSEFSCRSANPDSGWFEERHMQPFLWPGHASWEDRTADCGSYTPLGRESGIAYSVHSSNWLSDTEDFVVPAQRSCVYTCTHDPFQSERKSQKCTHDKKDTFLEPMGRKLCLFYVE